jgi:5-methylcytosine-specific restriction endonuclease McrA
MECPNCNNKVRNGYKYCNMQCRNEHWKEIGYNSFKGKTHTKETIEKIKSHPGYINRKTRKGMKHSEETKKKMSKKRKGGTWNHRYRHDVGYTGPERKKIIEWCRNHGGVPDEISNIWFNDCCVCGWGKTKCDIHHKIPIRLGGETKLNNLLVLCPNCHRLEHKKWNKDNEKLRKELYSNKGEKQNDR